MKQFIILNTVLIDIQDVNLTDIIEITANIERDITFPNMGMVYINKIVKTKSDISGMFSLG